MIEIVFGALGLVGLALLLLWLIGLPGEDDQEELAGFVTANWDEIKTRSITTEEPDVTDGIRRRPSRSVKRCVRCRVDSHTRAVPGWLSRHVPRRVAKHPELVRRSRRLGLAAPANLRRPARSESHQ